MPAESANDDKLSVFIGKSAVWTFTFENQDMQTVVRIVDVRRRRQRVDLLIETNAGSRAWAFSGTVQPIDLPNNGT